MCIHICGVCIYIYTYIYGPQLMGQKLAVPKKAEGIASSRKEAKRMSLQMPEARLLLPREPSMAQFRNMF